MKAMFLALFMFGCMDAADVQLGEVSAPSETPAPQAAPQPVVYTLTVGAAGANATSPLTVGGPEFFGQVWRWGDIPTSLFYPVHLRVGCTITSVRARLRKVSSNIVKFTVGLQGTVDGTSIPLGIAGTNQLAAPGVVTIPSLNVNELINYNVDYSIRVDRTGGDSPDDHSYWAAFDYTCP
jgi:hypothetical protein